MSLKLFLFLILCFNSSDCQEDDLMSLIMRLISYLRATNDNSSKHIVSIETCPKIAKNENSILFYMERPENPFTPGQPRHLLSTAETTNEDMKLHPRFRDIRPVNVDDVLQSIVYSSPIDVTAKCRDTCLDDKSCGYKRKCCDTPCGKACFDAVQIIGHS